MTSSIVCCVKRLCSRSGKCLLQKARDALTRGRPRRNERTKASELVAKQPNRGLQAAAQAFTSRVGRECCGLL